MGRSLDDQTLPPDLDPFLQPSSAAAVGAAMATTHPPLWVLSSQPAMPAVREAYRPRQKEHEWGTSRIPKIGPLLPTPPLGKLPDEPLSPGHLGENALGPSEDHHTHPWALRPLSLPRAHGDFSSSFLSSAAQALGPALSPFLGSGKL